MGGYGSGRQWGRPVVEDAKTIDVDWFRQKGVLEPHLWYSNSLIWSNTQTGEETGSIRYELETGADAGWIRLHYTITNHRSGEPFPVDYRVELVTTRPHFGGVRWWFVCPLSGRKVRKLYLHRCCDYFASRQALGLTYRSCRETAADRALRKAQKILCDRLGGTGVLDEVHYIPKPKGMHWKTFYRLRDAAEEASDRSWLEMATYIMKLRGVR